MADQPPPIDALKEQVWAAMDAWMDADRIAGEAQAAWDNAQTAASLKAHAFQSLYAQYLALKQESAAPELTLVSKPNQENAA